MGVHQFWGRSNVRSGFSAIRAISHSRSPSNSFGRLPPILSGAALPIFRFHYKEDNYAIFWNECHLAYALAMQENRKDFDEHFGICKQGEEKLKGTKLSETFRKNVVLIEQVLTGKPK